MSNAPLGTYRVRQIIPDYDHLMANPAAVLKRRSIHVGRLKMPLFLHPLIVIGLSFLFFRIWTEPEFDTRRIRIGLGVLAVVVLDLIRLMWPAQRALVLHKDGLELQYGSSVVWCPWSLFADAGRAVIANRGRLVQTIVLPVAPGSVPLVEWRRGTEILERGKAIDVKQFRFCSDSQAEMPARYAIDPQQLGDLILKLGRLLGRPKEDASAPVAAETAITRARSVAVASASLSAGLPVRAARPLDPGKPLKAQDSWIAIPVTRLHFPARCCHCYAPTLEVRSWQAKPSRFWSVPLLSFKREFAPLEIPLCANCSREPSCLFIPWMLVALAATMTAGCVAGTHRQIIAGTHSEAHGIEMAFLQIFFFLPVGLALGYCLDQLFARRGPFEARYRTADRTVLLRFQSRAFTRCWLKENEQLSGDT